MENMETDKVQQPTNVALAAKMDVPHALMLALTSASLVRKVQQTNIFIFKRKKTPPRVPRPVLMDTMEMFRLTHAKNAVIYAKPA